MTATAFGLKLKERGFARNRSTRPITYLGVAVSPAAVNMYGLRSCRTHQFFTFSGVAPYGRRHTARGDHRGHTSTRCGARGAA